MKYYHVAKNWNGEQLESLADYLIHLHASLADAIEYQKRYGGEILEIDEQGDDPEDCCVC